MGKIYEHLLVFRWNLSFIQLQKNNAKSKNQEFEVALEKL